MKHPALIGLSFLTAAALVLAQDAPPPPTVPANDGWKRVGESNPSPQVPNSQAPNLQAPNLQAIDPANDPPQVGVPAQLTIKSGTFVTVRLNQFLSSDRNQPGDAFTATLERPIVVDGLVVAQPGQTIAGHVVEAQKAGRVSGTSRLGVQLTDLTLVDGQQVPIQARLISRAGPTSTGRDAGAIAGTTALGAAVGAAAGWGTGAAIGAGAGALAGTIGVLLTRGLPTVITPESVLTFRIEEPVTFSTERAPQAFRYVNPNEYSQTAQPRLQPRPPGYRPPPRPPYYAVYPYGPYVYGPSVFIGIRGRRW